MKVLMEEKGCVTAIVVVVIAVSMNILFQCGMRIKGQVVCADDLMKYELSLMLVLLFPLEDLSVCWLLSWLNMNLTQSLK